MIKKLILFLLFLSILCFSQNTIIIERGFKRININDRSFYSISKSDSINFNFIRSQPTLSSLPIEINNISLIFQLKNINHSDSVFYITTDEEVSEFYLFTKDNFKLKKIG